MSSSHVPDIQRLIQCSEVGRDPATLVVPWLDFSLTITKNISLKKTCWVYVALILPSGELVLGTGNDEKLHVWSEGELQRELLGHTKYVTCIASLPSGEIVSGSSDKTVKIWNLADGTCLHTLPQGSFVYSICVLANRDLVCGLYNGKIKIWRNFQLFQTLEGHITGIKCLYPIAGSYDFASSSYDDHAIRLWKNGHCQRVLQNHTSSVRVMNVLANGNLLTGDCTGHIKIWKDNLCHETTLYGHTTLVTGFVSFDNGYWISTSYDKRVTLWNTHNECVQTLKMEESIFKVVRRGTFHLLLILYNGDTVELIV